MANDFQPAWFVPGPHAQTIWGRLVRPRRLVTLRREAIETPDGDELILDHLDGAIASPHFVLLHGLEGSSQSVYIQGVLSSIERHGYSATAINFRSCARDPQSLLRMIPNRRPRFYHSGETSDFDFVVRRLASTGVRLAAFGASLGGNVVLKWLGENREQQFVSAAATISVPYDLGAGAAFLESRAGRLYVNGFLKTLKKKVVKVVADFPELAEKVNVERALAAQTFREFDDAATAPLHGFADADDYYNRASSIHYLSRIATPTLCVSSADDPFLPREVLERVRAIASPYVDLRTTECGGHVGFVAGSMPWNCVYWAEELVVEWLVEKASLSS
ncbi:MAG: alpha/beta fold hydrolase [Thermoanaerobaculia bacterium]|nr:alpha/beta fold hydrolase [Thermoanaerobaculia bacterium]